ncbi:MAG: hypothetical protein M1820_004359 [Bogoriella megaspora]|nr:MAG: hypothetical protein M1820_004359 [Bogoriella megaspora]
MQNPNQFSRAPRFSLKPSQKPSQPPTTPSQSKPSASLASSQRPPPPRFWTQTPAREADTIDDSSQENILPTTELESSSPLQTPSSPTTHPTHTQPTSPSISTTDEPSFTTPPRPSKRPRFNPTSPPTASTPRFLPPRPHPSTTPSAVQVTTPAPSARRYIVPTPSSSVSATTVHHHHPVPEVFSPRKQGKKYVPGGLADTLRRWVVETGETAARRGGERERVVRVEEVGRDGGGGMVVARAEGVDILLVGGGGKEREKDVQGGSVVEVRPPVWGVALGGRRWVVGVDWRVR